MHPIENPRMSSSYCSLKRGDYPHPHPETDEEMIRCFAEILRREPMCRHDLKELNNIVTLIHPSSESLLNRATDLVSQRMDELSCNKIRRVNDLISLYHLKEYCAESFQETFVEKLSKYPTTPEMLREIANFLPCCESELAFEEDAKALLGKERPEEVTAILNQKKVQLRKHVKTEAGNRERGEFKDFPELYQHLMHMRSLNNRLERMAEIEKMSFEDISKIVLQTREAILKRVDVLPTGKTVVFILGGSGVGKSTALCFLRRDGMVYNDNRYVSKADQFGIIGDDGATSCTLLPNIEVLEEWVFIDFPGFDDTHGLLISLGMELALKALFNKHRHLEPKVLVLEAITNTEGRYAAAANLGEKLGRIFDKTHCILGITKYGLESNYIKLAHLEKQQLEKLSNPSEEEKELVVEINLLASMNQSIHRQNLLMKQSQLAQKTRARLEAAKKVVDTEEMKELRKIIKGKEDEIKLQIGVKNLVRFSDLEQEESLTMCLTEISALSRGWNVTLSPENRLDPMVQELLVRKFERNLLQIVRESQDYPAFEDIDNVKRSILQFSLIKILLTKSHPEIGDFLHLPEMDPRIVKYFDEQIITECIKNFIYAVSSSLDIIYLNGILDKFTINIEKKTILKEKLARLQECIEGITHEQWDNIRAEHQAALNLFDENFKMPKWLTFCCNIALKFPRGLLGLMNKSKAVNAHETAFDDLINQSCAELDQMHKIILTLKEIERIITEGN